MLRRRIVAVLLTVLMLCGTVGNLSPASAEPPAPPQTTDAKATAKPTLAVAIKTPKGVPATVRVVRGKSSRYVTKADKGSSATRSLVLAGGTYTIQPLPVVKAGRIYAPTRSSIKVAVKSGKVKKVTVTYKAVKAARSLSVAKLQSTAVQLSWSAPAKAKLKLRVVAGAVATKSATGGRAVSAGAKGAKATKLTPGRTYAFSLFTRLKGRWMGPLTVVSTTLPPAGSTAAVFVATPSTVIVTKPAVVTDSPAPGRITTAVPAGVTPTISQTMVLPVSADLPGGFVGKVSGVSSDGKSVTLVQAGLSDAFDTYSVQIDSFTGSPIDLVPDPSPAGVVRLKSAGVQTPDTARRRDGAAVKQKAAGLASCLGGGLEAKLSFNAPSLTPMGSFSVELDKKNLLGLSIPTKVRVSSEIKFKLSQTMNVKVEGTPISCGIPYKPVAYKLPSIGPVPMLLYFTPVTQVGITGEVEFNGVGVDVTNGFWAKATIGLTSGASVVGGPISTAQPILPAPKNIKGRVEVKVGGQLIVGPGVNSKDAGVVAGLSGELNLLNAAFGTAYPAGDARFGKCFEGTATFSAEAGLTAKVWAGNWDVSAKLTVPIGKPVNLGGPWYVPTGCNTLPDPGQDVIGSGVTKTSDEVSGSAEQWGKTDVFTTGTPAWILSTGRMSSISGTGSDDASTNLELGGDERLSSLVDDRPTFDAAAYTATVIPAGNKLHVRYIFASEEYPEYVNSQYNDVMAVFVDGVNCAKIGDDPVAVNTVNHLTNTDFYIANDGSQPTSMDGFTVPLECNVAVTPGVPVTVQVAVADTSDGILDSAVGLLEKGIWSD